MKEKPNWPKIAVQIGSNLCYIFSSSHHAQTHPTGPIVRPPRSTPQFSCLRNNLFKTWTFILCTHIMYSFMFIIFMFVLTHILNGGGLKHIIKIENWMGFNWKTDHCWFLKEGFIYSMWETEKENCEENGKKEN